MIRSRAPRQIGHLRVKFSKTSSPTLVRFLMSKNDFFQKRRGPLCRDPWGLGDPWGAPRALLGPLGPHRAHGGRPPSWGPWGPIGPTSMPYYPGVDLIGMTCPIGSGVDPLRDCRRQFTLVKVSLPRGLYHCYGGCFPCGLHFADSCRTVALLHTSVNCTGGAFPQCNMPKSL